MDEVANGIFVGTESEACDESFLRKHGVDVVISLTHRTPETGDVNRVDVPMVDGPQNDYEDFTEAVEKVVRQRENGNTVLIHCSAGASRSPSVAAAAITHLTEKNLNEAFNQIIEHRPEADPHDALIKQAVKLVERVQN
jgi:protein-tyrosine phosphatase